MISKKIVSIDIPKNRNSILISKLDIIIQSNIKSGYPLAPISLHRLIKKLSKHRTEIKSMLKETKNVSKYLDTTTLIKEQQLRQTSILQLKRDAKKIKIISIN